MIERSSLHKWNEEPQVAMLFLLNLAKEIYIFCGTSADERKKNKIKKKKKKQNQKETNRKSYTLS